MKFNKKILYCIAATILILSGYFIMQGKEKFKEVVLPTVPDAKTPKIAAPTIAFHPAAVDLTKSDYVKNMKVLPKFNPETVLNIAKNPGLGIQKLHSKV